MVLRSLALRPLADRRPSLLLAAAATLFAAAACSERTPLDTSPTTAGEIYLAAALDILEAHSLHRYEIDWPELRRRVHESAGKLETAADAYPAIRHALTLIGEEHSTLLAPSDTAGAHASLNRRPVIQQVNGLVGTDAPLGYVGVPEATGRDIRALAATYHRQIEQVDTAGACGWVVDLRRNFGGSMWPMLAGLGPILGEGTLGYFVDPDSVRTPWAYEDGASLRDGVPIVELDRAYVLRKPSPPVAVLVDPFTASSAEGVMISFIGRPKTRSFGLRTAGFSTTNRAFTLSDGAILLVTTSVMADRTGRPYGSQIWPDTLASGDRTLSVETDTPYRAALEWLRDQEGCG